VSFSKGRRIKEFSNIETEGRKNGTSEGRETAALENKLDNQLCQIDN